MNYEQKYKEALKIMESLHSVVKYQSSSDALLTSQTIEKAFPELRESEDERIRKALITFFQRFPYDSIEESGTNAKDALAWLEKQGHDGKKWIYEDVYIKEKEQLIQDGIDEVLENPQKYGLEKQGETENEDDTDFTIYHPLKNGSGKYECIPYSFYGSLTSFSEDEDLINFLRNCFYTEKECKEWIEKQGEQNSDNKAESMEYNYITPNPEFFQWIYDRLVHVHNENPNVDFMLSLKERIEDMQKPSDKAEPKFKVGNWILIDNPCQIESIDNNGNYVVRYCDTEETHLLSRNFCDSHFHLWTIQDAKDGDVLSGKNPFIFRGFRDKKHPYNPTAYCGIDSVGHFILSVGNNWWTAEDLHPATKEQRNLLFQKMKEAGYEWNSNKKKLMKIEQSCYHNDGLYYAINILEKTLGKVEGYQSDDGKMEHQAAIETVKALYHKKPTEWSEEDEANMDAVWKACGQVYGTKYQSVLGDWLKSIKPQENLYDKGYNDGYSAAKYNHWKPSEEQMMTLCALCVLHKESKVLESLYNDLKSL